MVERKLLFSFKLSKSKARLFYKISRNNNTNILNKIVFLTPKAWLVLVILSFDIKSRMCHGGCGVPARPADLYGQKDIL